MKLQKITLCNLVASAQPRPLLTSEVDKLAASIKEVGLIQPITVRESVVIRGTAEQGWQIVAGHHRVAACRALGWTEIDAIVIDDASHLQSELMEIDENLCRAELTASQRTGYTKRRKQIWEALNPPAATQRFDSVFDALGMDGEQVGTDFPPVAKHGHAQEKGFAASTAEATGMTKRAINQQLARADAIGDEALTKVTNTSLDSGVELDALAKMPAPERTELIERAAAGEQVSARTQAAPVASKPAPDRQLPIKLYKAVQALLKTMGCNSVDDLVDEINKLPELTKAEQSTLDDALNDLTAIGTLMGATE
jgi:hypothetical protein